MNMPGRVVPDPEFKDVTAAPDASHVAGSNDTIEGITLKELFVASTPWEFPAKDGIQLTR
jgi:hypothetical protein